MKKFGIYLVIVMCLFITGCGEDKTRVATTLDEFESVATSGGFSVSDESDSYKSVSYIEGSRVATYDEVEIEIIVYSDSDYASQVQEQQIESFNMLKSTGAYAEKEKGSNYYEYALVSNGRYMISSRVDNTLIFAKVMLEDRETVDALIDSVGY